MTEDKKPNLSIFSGNSGAYSVYSTSPPDPKWWIGKKHKKDVDLVKDLHKFIKQHQPKIVTLENVPGYTITAPWEATDTGPTPYCKRCNHSLWGSIRCPFCFECHQ